MKTKVLWSFCAGLVVSVGARSLREDYWGKEQYIRIVQENWIDPKITVPIGILLLLLGFTIFGFCAWKEK